MIPIRVSVVTYDSAETIERCIDSVRSQPGGFEIRITIVDNDSRDDTVELIRARYPDIDLILPGRNLGFGAGHNLALHGCSEPCVLLVNPDAWLLDGAIERLVAVLDERRDVALAGPRMEYEDGRPQLSFGRFPGLLADLHQKRLTRSAKAGSAAVVERLNRLLESPFEPDWISGACVLARRSALDSVGNFDERFFLYLEDVDLCRRLREEGWRVRVEPRAVCRHAEGHSSDTPNAVREHYRRSRLLYENKFGSRLGFVLYKLLRARHVDVTWDDRLREHASK